MLSYTNRKVISMPVGTVLALCISAGGIPKSPVPMARVTVEGLEGDGRNHAKHVKPSRAVSLIDEEMLDELRAEGFPLPAGATGENIVVEGLDVQHLDVGAVLKFSGGVVLELTEMRKPCFVLDSIDPRLKEVIVGRCGFMARVIREGCIATDEKVHVSDHIGDNRPDTYKED